MPRRKKDAPADKPPRRKSRAPAGPQSEKPVGARPGDMPTTPAYDVPPGSLPEDPGELRAELDPTAQSPVEVDVPELDNQFLSVVAGTLDMSSARVGDEVSRAVAEDFEERQAMNAGGTRELAEKLSQHTSLSPLISGGDVDAAWDYARMSGEETFTGHAPTPDQDVVDELGEAAGLTYRDDEPLNYGKVSERDAHRWELDPRSALAGPATNPLAALDDDDEAAGEYDDDDEDAEAEDAWTDLDDMEDLDALDAGDPEYGEDEDDDEADADLL
jgi:hypothetical protein